MGVHHWKELQHKMGAARRKQLRREVEQEILDMDLRGLRELVGKTQKDLAMLVEQTQGQVSDTDSPRYAGTLRLSVARSRSSPTLATSESASTACEQPTPAAA
jgi:hypothetical protein